MSSTQCWLGHQHIRLCAPEFRQTEWSKQSRRQFSREQFSTGSVSWSGFVPLINAGPTQWEQASDLFCLFSQIWSSHAHSHWWTEQDHVVYLVSATPDVPQLLSCWISQILLQAHPSESGCAFRTCAAKLERMKLVKLSKTRVWSLLWIGWVRNSEVAFRNRWKNVNRAQVQKAKEQRKEKHEWLVESDLSAKNIRKQTRVHLPKVWSRQRSHTFSSELNAGEAPERTRCSSLLTASPTRLFWANQILACHELGRALSLDEPFVHCLTRCFQLEYSRHGWSRSLILGISETGYCSQLKSKEVKANIHSAEETDCSQLMLLERIQDTSFVYTHPKKRKHTKRI